jgi:hypothetical protein
MDETLAQRYVVLVCDKKGHAHPRTPRSIVECAWLLIATETST